MKRVCVLLTASLAACANITGTPTHAMKGMWALQQYAGHALPAFQESFGTDSAFLVADTLWFDGHGNYTRMTWVSVWTPTGTSGGGGGERGTYTAAGDAVVLHAWIPDVPDVPRYGRRTADALVFPADGTKPSMLYER